MIGSTLSHYRIVEKLGEGGMGVVYKAEDTKLERTVALKFLAEHLLNDAEAKERFLREAKAAAALHHPNVCPVHEIDEADGKTFLAMAFLKGETLEDRIAKGPLPIKDALDIARQVAEGLQAAHVEGIVHRDIKPANVLVSPEGRPTIMDFGLARLTEASRLTKVDTAMGTAAYMSPEQAQGMEVDHRTDLWALGCMLYEMVSGQRPFRGQYDQALLYEIVHEEVAPLTSVRAGVPMELEFIAGKCLAKEAADRYQHASDIAVDLRTLGDKLRSGRSTILRTAPMTGTVPATRTTAHTINPAEALPPDSVVMPRSKQRLMLGLLAATTLALVAVTALFLTQAPPEQPERAVTRFSLAPEGFGTDFLRTASISPDGMHILYRANDQGVSSLWVRSLASESRRRLGGTEEALAGFWSPDSRSIGFATREELKRVSLSGGDAITLCELPSSEFRFWGGTWSPGGETIVFSSGLQGSTAGVRLFEVPAVGGMPQQLLRAEDSLGLHFFPHFLPSAAKSRALVYTASRNGPDGTIVLLDLESKERRELGPGSAPVYSPSGHLIFGRANEGEDGLMARAFSLETLEATGESFPIDDAGQFPSVSENGMLVFQNTLGSVGQRLVWRDRHGELLESVGQPQVNIYDPVLSPDGQRVVVMSPESGSRDLWIHDLTRSTKTRLTSDAGFEQTPVWSPSGREIAYSTRQGDVRTITSKAADGAGESVVLVHSDHHVEQPDWSRDGRYLIYSAAGTSNTATANQVDIRYVLREEGGYTQPVAFVDTAANERAPKLSPDDRWLAYVSDESGRPEVYVSSFPSGGDKFQASVNGGTQPVWRHDGAELFYVEGSALMAVAVSTEQGLVLGQAQMLFESGDLAGPYATPKYDVDPSGQRFLTVAPFEDENAPPPSIRVVMNWYEEFRKKP